MKPHRRKDVPPRREHDQEHVPDTGAEADPAAYEQPQVDPVEEVYEQGGYDPGQALADQSQPYGEQYADPNAYQQPDPNVQPLQPGATPYVPPPPPVSGAGVYDTAPLQPPPPDPAPAPAPKRKAAVKRGGRRPATRKAPTRRPKPSYSSGGGGGVMAVFMTILALGMLGVVVWAMLPTDMSGIKGFPYDPLTKTEPKNLLEEAQKVMLNRNSELALSEEDVNLYLNHRLQGQQGGIIGSIVKFRAVYIDFAPETAEIFIEREIFGQAVTMSSKMAVDHVRGIVNYRPVGWSIGRFQFSSRNIKPVVDMFVRLRKTCSEEVTVLQQMANIRFEENKVVLDPVM